MGTPRQSSAAAPLTVSEVNRLARSALEDSLGLSAVIGEISNLARPQSGHIYFSLKDNNAQLRCAYFRQRQRGLDFRPENGDEVIAIGRISLYEPRGDYQLIVDQLQVAGSGALQRKFEALRAKLTSEGLFAAANKQSIPPLPRRIGVVTSPSGAAVRDILHVLARRFPAVPVRIYPSAVQGAEAANELTAALQRAAASGDVDVIILARGGGSIEDLWSFNDETLVRTIAALTVPVVSGVGHETDVTLADLVADVRAPTPSGAAELVVPDWREVVSNVRRIGRSLSAAMQRRMDSVAQRLDNAARTLTAHSPAAALSLRRERQTVLQLRMASALARRLKRYQQRIGGIDERLRHESPTERLRLRERLLADLSGRSVEAIRARLNNRQRRFAVAARALNAVSPLATLGRGYALVTDAESDTVIRDAASVTTGQPLRVRLANGRLRVRAEHDED
ncbi:MAG: exodeoxyribonuclease VII large subunit [Pseudomonadota bacterium]